MAVAMAAQASLVALETGHSGWLNILETEPTGPLGVGTGMTVTRL